MVPFGVWVGFTTRSVVDFSARFALKELIIAYIKIHTIFYEINIYFNISFIFSDSFDESVFDILMGIKKIMVSTSHYLRGIVIFKC